jgi:hypothetical protein
MTGNSRWIDGRRAALELLVIIAGVLIALTVDGWVEARRDRRAEAEYLARLGAEVAIDIDEIADRLAGIDQHEVASRAALAFFDQPAGVGDTLYLVRTLHSAGMFDPFRYERSTFDDLLSTGGLGLIRSGDLRQQIGAYDRQGADLLDFDRILRERFILTYRDRFSLWVDARIIFYIDTQIRPELTPMELDVALDRGVDLKGLASDEVLRAAIGDNLGAMNYRRSEFRVIRGAAQQLLSSLDAELSARR